VQRQEGQAASDQKKASNKVTSSHQKIGAEQSQRQNGGNRLQLDPVPMLAFQLGVNPESCQTVAVRGTKVVEQQTTSSKKLFNCVW
jgi:hypothetical protein